MLFRSALIRGIGDIVEPKEPIHKYIILANPGISVSTREAYEAIDGSAIGTQNIELFENDFEEYTLGAYPEAAELKKYMQNNLCADSVLMSGSGPTMVAYYSDKAIAEENFITIKEYGYGRDNLRVWLTETGSQR